MSIKKKQSVAVEDSGNVEQAKEIHISNSLKPTWDHREKVSEEHQNTREPYWDTPYVIGAGRNITEASGDSEQKRSRRDGLLHKLWRQYRKYWIRYTIAAIDLLAIGLPIL
jgi:hypothetical protein